MKDGLELAVEAGLSPFEYYDLTPSEFKAVVNAYRNRIQKEYSIAKFIGYFSLRPHLDKANSHKSIDDLIPLPWDKKPTVKAQSITLDEFNLMRKKFKL